MDSIGKPTTLGKIERWHRTYDEEIEIQKTRIIHLNITTTKEYICH